jgi:hypothetical protein
MRTPRTYFEQIPVKAVKSAVRGETSANEEAGTANLTLESASRKTEPYSMPADSLCKR